MTGDRATEKERRKLAQENRGKVKADSGRALEPRKLDQMVSLRLDPDLVGQLRRVAEDQGRSISDVIREATVRHLERLSSLQVTIDFEVPVVTYGQLERFLLSDEVSGWTVTAAQIESKSGSLTSVGGYGDCA